MEKTFYLEDGGCQVTIGKFAGQASGAAWLKQGGTIVLATVCCAPSKEFPGFFPLTVDYREQFAAAGKIPGGYFKREGKFSDREVLTGRLIDRALRPLFPEHFFDAVQILITVYSVDKEHMPHTLALLAASIALSVSDIPFTEPVGVAEIGRVDGAWIINPTYTQSIASDARIIVAGTHDGVCMVEGSAQEMQEQEFIDTMFLAHASVQKQVAWQRDIMKELSATKRVVVEHFNWSMWEERAQKFLTDDIVLPLFTQDKVARSTLQDSIQEAFFKLYEAEVKEQAISKTFLEYVFDGVLKTCITELCFKKGHRVDMRPFEQVRSITTEVGLLPFAHGSSLFWRGRTQALVSVTLGSGQDEAKIDNLMGAKTESAFMLHYNFPPFSVGEVRQQRAVGRREIGHGYLAATAIQEVLPKAEEFPYTIRVVSDILESDGSSSMATVCGATMALMDAGVPIKKMVGGVAMGLLRNNAGQFQVLTDIAGIEDSFGLMDFKVAGTTEGITAIQMDIKHKGGLSRHVFDSALAAAKIGRLHILQKMVSVMDKPRKQLSELVPQFTTFKIAVDKIGAVIGSGGKVIREIIEKTGTTIDIEDDGLVKIFGNPGSGLEQAIAWVKTLGGQIERGMKYQGTIKRVAEFGVFVEVAPGQDGLVHVSALPRGQQEQILNSINIGDKASVEVIDYDSETGRIRLKFI
jgi:polyribonucleotide nucleotidyltransferase